MTMKRIIMLCIGLTASYAYCTVPNKATTPKKNKSTLPTHGKVAGQGAGPVEREWYEIEVAKRKHRGEKSRNYGPKDMDGNYEFLIFGKGEYEEIIPNPDYQAQRSFSNKNYNIYYKEPVRS